MSLHGPSGKLLSLLNLADSSHSCRSKWWIRSSLPGSINVLCFIENSNSKSQSLCDTYSDDMSFCCIFAWYLVYFAMISSVARWKKILESIDKMMNSGITEQNFTYVIRMKIKVFKISKFLIRWRLSIKSKWNHSGTSTTVMVQYIAMWSRQFRINKTIGKYHDISSTL
jgi:hypothetical protein